MSDLDTILSEPSPAPAAGDTATTILISPPPAGAGAARAQRPSLRRMVAYYEYADVECSVLVERAAMIVHVWSDTCVNLVVWDQHGDQRCITSVTLGTGHRSWAWPEVV